MEEEEEPPSRLAEVVGIVVLATVFAVFYAGVFMPGVAPFFTWTAYLLLGLVLWAVVKFVLPEAWQYRRSDLGGLALVLSLLIVVAYVFWDMLANRIGQ